MFKSHNNKRFAFTLFGSSLILGVFGFLVFFVMPLSGGNKTEWVIGPMSTAHKFIEGNCSTCHSNSFSPIRDENCTACHNVSEHSEEKISNKSCVSCHLEYSGNAGLMIKDSKICLSCHENLAQKKENTEIKNITSFKDHPIFALPAKDLSQINLNHEVHLRNNIRAEEGYVTLTCASCHQVSPQNGLMLPVSYEGNCKSCHKLEVSLRSREITVPHGNSEKVFDFLYKELLAIRYAADTQVPGEGGRTRPGLSAEKDQKLRASVAKEAREEEKNLFLETGCALCHSVRSISGAEGESFKASFEVVKPSIPFNWFKHSSFDHRGHEVLTCESCHQGVQKSGRTEDVLMPKIADCRSCHSDEGGASQDCMTCHSYHDSVDLQAEKKRGLVELGIR